MSSTKLRIHAPAITYFDTARRSGSIREAARRLHVSSSAVNRQIIKLEEEVGASLFERLPAGLRLTAAGEVFARHVLTVLQDAERTRSELDALNGLRTGHVELATVEGVTTDLLPTVISRMRARYPRVAIGVVTMGSHAIPRALASGNADLGLAFSLPPTAELRQLAVGRFRLGAVMRPEHELARRDVVSFAECMQSTLVIAKRDLSIYDQLQPIMPGAMDIDSTIESASVELGKQLSRSGIAISFQTRIGLERDLAAGSLVHVPLAEPEPIYSNLGVYVRAGRSLPVAVEAFARILSEEVIERESQESGFLG